MCLHYKSYENTGKRRIRLEGAISAFPPVFPTLSEKCLPFPSYLKLSSAKSSLWERLKFALWKGLTLSQISPGFYLSAVQVLKTLWEKEKLLIMSNLSFSRSVYYPFRELSAIFIKSEIVICKLSIWNSLKFVVWEFLRIKKKAFENECRKGENAGNQHCLLFP